MSTVSIVKVEGERIEEAVCAAIELAGEDAFETVDAFEERTGRYSVASMLSAMVRIRKAGVGITHLPTENKRLTSRALGFASSKYSLVAH